jgi:hypothetical protein
LPLKAHSLSFPSHYTGDSMSDWGTTNRVPAEAMLAEGIVFTGDLHLLARDTFPTGPETPLEMLNRPEPFFVLTLSDGGVTFIPKAQVAVLSCHDQKPLSDPERISAAKLVALEIVLEGGAEYRGRATFELPANRGRALDFVNAPGGFFSLWSDEVTWYINKSHVRHIRPLD